MNSKLSMNFKVDKNSLSDYYNSNPVFELPSDSKFRYYRISFIDDDDGVVYKTVRKKIRRSSDLLSVCKEYLPFAVYHSVSMFLCPTHITSRGGTDPSCNSKFLSNLFMYSDYVVDCDSPHCSRDNLSLVFHTLSSLYSTPKIVVTGSGFHFHVSTPFRHITSVHKNPFNRESKDRSLRKKLTRSLRSDGLLFDFPVSMDTRRIVRVVGSLHQSGKIISSLSPMRFCDELHIKRCAPVQKAAGVCV